MIMTKNPLRVSLAGGGTDSPIYFQSHGGLVVSMTIDIFVTVRIEGADTPIKPHYKWIDNHLRHVGLEDDCIKIIIDDQREGRSGGLGNSSACSVGLLKALYQYIEVDKTPGDIAREACNLNIELHGINSVGYQDEYACAHGGLNAILFPGNNPVQIRPFPDKLGEQLSEMLMLFELPITGRASSFMMKMQNTDPTKTAHYRHQVKSIANTLFDLLREENITPKSLGRILNLGWENKKHLAPQMTNELIDRSYKRALSAGAYGAKVCGAGGGGYCLVCCNPDRRDRIRKAMQPDRELEFGYYPRPIVGTEAKE